MRESGEVVGTCFVCERDVAFVPLVDDLEAQRKMNVPVWVGPDKVRHSYCAPGTIRWARHMNPEDPREREWLRRFGFDPDAVPVEEEGEMSSKKKSPTAKAPKAEKVAKPKKEKVAKAPKEKGPSKRLADKRLPPAGTVFSREYKGKKINVTVQEDGTLRWDGTNYHSLSALAKAVTEYPSISGYQFFEKALEEAKQSA